MISASAVPVGSTPLDNNSNNNSNNNNNNNSINSNNAPDFLNEDLFSYQGIGGALSRTLSVFGVQFPVFMTLTGIMMIPGAVIGITALVLSGEALVELQDGGIQDGIDFFKHHLTSIILIFLVQLLVAFVTFIAGEGAMIHAAAGIYANDHTLTWQDNLKVGLQRFCNVFLAGLTIFVAVIIGVMVFDFVVLGMAMLLKSIRFLFILIVIAYYVTLLCVGFYIAASTMVLFPIIVIENKGPIDAIKRSFELSEGDLCFLFCAVFLLGVAKSVLSHILLFLFMDGGKNPFGVFSPGGFIVVFLLPTLFFLPLQSILRFVIYANVRVIKEGLNEPTLQSELAGQHGGYVTTATAVLDEDPDAEAVAFGGTPGGAFAAKNIS